MKARKKQVQVDIWYMDEDHISGTQVLECIAVLNDCGELDDEELSQLN